MALPPTRRPTLRQTLGPTLVVAAVSLVAAVLILGPALLPGYTLSYDMVFVPHLPWSPELLGITGGPPRAVPSDAVVSVLSSVVPGWVVQKAVLLATLTLAGLGAGRLLMRDDGRWLGPTAAAVAFVWNPYVFERLVLGHWTLLLGYAALPWGVGAVRGRAGVAWRPLSLATVAAAIGGAQGFVVFGPAMLVVVAVSGSGSRRRWRDTAGLAVLLVLVNAPWWVPGLLAGAGVRVDPTSLAAFAPRADTALGTVGSLVALGGIWNADVAPSGRDGIVVAAATLLLLATAVAGLVVSWSALPAWRRGLVAAAGSYLVVLLAILGPMHSTFARLLSDGLAWGLLRDGQKLVAPLALLWAVGLGGAAGATRHLATREVTRRAAAAVVVALPLAVVPSLAWGAAGRLGSVWYPTAWDRAGDEVSAVRDAGAVLVLPWGAFRRFDWNDGRTVLDPAPRWFGGVAFSDDRLPVGDLLVAPETSVTSALTAQPTDAARAQRAADFGATAAVTEVASTRRPDETGSDVVVTPVPATGPLPPPLPWAPIVAADIAALLTAVAAPFAGALRRRFRLLP